MATRKKSALGRLITTIITVVPAVLALFGNITTIIEYELQKIGKKLSMLIMLFIIFAVVASSTWLCLQAMTLVYLVSLQFSWLTSLVIIFLLNLLTLSIVLLYLRTAKEKLLSATVTRFKKTRSN